MVEILDQTITQIFMYDLNVIKYEPHKVGRESVKKNYYCKLITK